MWWLWARKSGVLREPDLSRFIFPDQGAQRQVELDGLLALHQWHACLGVAEDQYLPGAQAQSRLLCFGGMVDVREELSALLGKERLQALDVIASPLIAG